MAATDYYRFNLNILTVLIKLLGNVDKTNINFDSKCNSTGQSGHR